MKQRVSEELLAFAAAAYDYHAELTAPARCTVMLRVTRERFDEARRVLPVPDCQYLSRLAGRT